MTMPIPTLTGGRGNALKPIQLGIAIAALLWSFGCSRQPSAAPAGTFEAAIKDASQSNSERLNFTGGADLSGGEVSVLGMVDISQKAKFDAALVPFEQATGIDVEYASLESFTTRLPQQVKEGRAPDIAILPQPGLIADFIRDEELVALSDFIDAAALRTAFPDRWIDLGTFDRKLYALWYRVSVKSLVWYRPTAFEAKGYDIPTTWAALMALGDRIVAEGGTPWCIGLESGDITGWPGTDWIEDILLRTGGPEAYRQWVTHQIPFQSPPVLAAFNEFDKILRRPKYVSGGAKGTLAMSYTSAPEGLFTEPPSCYLHRQANFITATFPGHAAARIDYDMFPLPGIDERFGTPLLVAGDALVMFNDTPEARALMKYFTTATPYATWATLGGGFISPHKQVSPQAYPDAMTQRIAQVLADAEAIHFDGSDMMPAEVGTDTFLSGIVEFAEGAPAEAVAGKIDDSWP